MFAKGTESKKNVNSRGESPEKLTFLLSVLLASMKNDNDIPGEILEGYVEAVLEINDEIVYQVQQEEDVEHDIP